jgi:hypothetical protein
MLNSVVFLAILFSIAPTLITLKWLRFTKRKGYSWLETWKIEMHNSDISYAEYGLYMAGYDMSYIIKSLPKRIAY